MGAVLGAVVAASVVAVAPAAAATHPYPVTGWATVSPSGVTGNANAFGGGMSTGGRFIVFSSAATNVVAGAQSGHTDVYVRDTLAGTTRRVSVSTTGALANADSNQPAITPDGRFVVFQSAATNLVPGATNGHQQIYLRDLALGGTLRQVSVAQGSGSQGSADSAYPTVSAGGNLVAFSSKASNLVALDGNNAEDTFVRNVSAATTERIDVTSAEVAFDKGSRDAPSMSPDGRYVAFDASNDQLGGTSTDIGVFLRDRTAGTTVRASLTDADTPVVTGDSQFPSVSADGRYVAFKSYGTNLLGATTPVGQSQVYVRDRTTGHTERVSVTTGGAIANDSSGNPQISSNGRFVAFDSTATNLSAAATTAGRTEGYVRDRTAATTTLVSTSTSGVAADSSIYNLLMSPDGTTFGWTTFAKNLGSPVTGTAFNVGWHGPRELGALVHPDTFLIQQYTDFAGRTPTTAEQTAWTKALVQGTLSPATEVVTLAHGSFATYRAPVTRLYWAFFKRLPDAGGFAYWVGQFQGGRSLASIADFFATSAEFQATYGSNTTNAQFVTLVYQNVLGRSPDAGGLSYWVGQLGSGVHRGAMLVGFSESAEGKALRRPEVDTVLLFEGMLHRLPNAGEFAAWVPTLRGGPTSPSYPSEDLALQLLTSAVYAARFP